MTSRASFMRICTLLSLLMLVFAQCITAQSCVLIDPWEEVSHPQPTTRTDNVEATSSPDRILSPGAALKAYQERESHQALELADYRASSLIKVYLPATAQRGELELQMQFIAPQSLNFIPVRFTGDRFVKSNIIHRVLQWEVEHVQGPDRTKGTLNASNYVFNHTGFDFLDGSPVYVFGVKPRHKQPWLFKGQIYLNVATGTLRRAKGTMVKSPSFFIRKIQFVQDYADFDNFTLPVHLHSDIRARILGKITLDIVKHDYAFSSERTGTPVPIGD